MGLMVQSSLHKFILTMATATVLAGVVQSQTAQDPSGRIRAAVAARDWNSAQKELQTLRSADPSLFRSRDYDYLLARVAEETSDIGTSTAAYEKTITNNSILAEYALWHLARVALSLIH